MDKQNELQFFSNPRLVQPLKVPLRHDLSFRWYEIDGIFKPSVSTFLGILNKGIGFDMWLGNANSYKDAMEYASERADLGSKVHTDIAHLILDNYLETGNMTDENIRMLQEFVQFWNHYKPKAVTIECPLWVDDIPFAGTGDLICEVNNETWLVDWKTGELWDSYNYQIKAYQHLAEKVFNIKIDKCCFVQINGKHRGTCFADDKPKYKLKEVKKDYSLDFLKSIYNLWVENNNNPQPKFPEALPKILTLEEENEPNKE